jgi:hypothetical protein
VNDLRLEVAAAHGLDPEAAQFLDGATLEQLEAQAAKLAELLAASRPADQPEPQPTLADVFANADARKQLRRRTLCAALHPRESQPRDEQGRYARPASFDGGARPLAPRPLTHDQVLAAALAAERARGSRSFTA